MNRERDIERVLDAWLAQGPTVMPDRLFDDVLERIERRPQRRLARLQLRITTMRPTTLFAVAAAITIAIGAGIILLGRPATPDVAAPTAPASTIAPAPSAPATAAPADPASALPPELQHWWLGAPRSVPEAGYGDTAMQLLDLDANGYARVSLGLMPSILPSTPSMLGDGQVRFTTAIGDAGCETGMVGDYRYALSPDGMTLTLEATQDACAARAGAFSGTWTRSACRNPDNACLGIVPAGTYVSTFLDVRSTPEKELSRGAYGQLRYTVPDGWANEADWPDGYALVPAEEYAGAVGDPGRGDAWHGIYVHKRPAATAIGEECSSELAPGVGTSAAELAAWIAQHPALEASAPAPVAVGDLTGSMVDVRLRDGWPGTCPDAPAGVAMANLLAKDSTEMDRWEWGIGTGELQRLIFVDIGPGQTVLIGIDTNRAPAQARFDELVSEAMPIIESFEFAE